MQRQIWTELLADIIQDEGAEAGISETADHPARQGQEVINLTADNAAETDTASQPQPPPPQEGHLQAQDDHLPVFGPHLRIGDRLRIERERRRMLAEQQALIASCAFEAKRRSMDQEEGLSAPEV